MVTLTPRSILLLASLVLLAWCAPASAEVEREILTNAEPTNLVNITPVRIESTVDPGNVTVERISIFNDSDLRVSMKSTVFDFGPPTDEGTLGEPVPPGLFEFGASSWITPELVETVLEPFEKVTFDVVVEPPLDAPVGSSYAAIEYEFAGGDEPEGSSEIGLRITALMQILLTVPGPIEHDLKFLKADTRDAFRIGNTSFVSYDLRYRNDGTVHEHIKGEIEVTSIFGNVVETIDLGERVLIRGATGTDRATWTDLPRFGIFTATATIEGDDGTKHSRDIERIVLLPPWWVIALLVASLVIPPIWVWHRRRQEWLAYLEDEGWDEGEEDGEYA